MTVPEPEFVLEAALEPVKLPSSEDIPPISARTAVAMAKADKKKFWSCILAVVFCVSGYNSDSNEIVVRSELKRLALMKKVRKLKRKNVKRNSEVEPLIVEGNGKETRHGKEGSFKA